MRLAEFFGRLFVRDYSKTEDPRVRERYGVMASIVGIAVNLLLFFGKFSVGLLTASIAIQADAMNNLSDAGASVVSLISFRIAARPADREHPFGHARMEYVASMIVSFLVLLIGVELFSESVTKIVRESDISFSRVAVFLLFGASLCKLWLYCFYRSVGKRIGSEVLRAAAQDSLSDVVATVAVLLSHLLCEWTGWQIDGYVGIAVSVFILVAGLRILNETKNHILGTAPKAELLTQIEELVLARDGIFGIHDLIVHNYGPGRCFASLHAEVDGRADVFVVHDMIDGLEKQIAEKLGVQCVIHMDPIVTDDEVVNTLRRSVAQAVTAVDPRLSMHDFRFVVGQTRSSLIFDVVAPFEIPWSADEVRDRVAAQIAALDPTYCAVITVDRQ